MKNPKTKIILIIIGFILAVVLTFGITFYFLNSQLGVIGKDLENAQEQVKTLEEKNKANNDFFIKYSEAISLVNKAYYTYQLADVNFGYARYYDTLTDNLYTTYSLSGVYSYDAHISFLDTSISQHSDAILTIKKANKLLLEIKDTTQDSFWSKEIELRIEQAKLFEELFTKSKQLVESNKNIQYYYYQLKDQNLYQNELNNFNNKLLPDSNELREKVINKLTEINLFWDEDIYSTK